MGPTKNEVQHVEHSEVDHTYAVIGGKKVPFHDVIKANASLFQPTAAAAPSHKFGNPVTMGFSAFAISSLLLAMYNLQSQGVKATNAIISCAFFVGGLGQFIAGQWEIVVENSFAATGMSGFGAFWMSFGAILAPAFGIVEAYEGHMDQLENALGFYTLSWFFFSSMLTICVIRSTYVFLALFLCLDMTFLLNAIYYFTGRHAILTASAIFNICMSCLAFYCAYAGLATRENTYLVPKVYFLPGSPYAKTTEQA